jgi:hypothetical protein
LSATVPGPAHHPELGRDQQQDRQQANKVSKLPNPNCASICLHAATLTEPREKVLIDKLCGSIGLTDARTNP